MVNTTEWKTSPNEQPVGDIPCKFHHDINGVEVTKEDKQFHGQSCDCKRVVFMWEYCNCSKGMMIKQKPNPNY